MTFSLIYVIYMVNIIKSRYFRRGSDFLKLEWCDVIGNINCISSEAKCVEVIKNISH